MTTRRPACCIWRLVYLSPLSVIVWLPVCSCVSLGGSVLISMNAFVYYCRGCVYASVCMCELFDMLLCMFACVSSCICIYAWIYLRIIIWVGVCFTVGLGVCVLTSELICLSLCVRLDILLMYKCVVASLWNGVYGIQCLYGLSFVSLNWSVPNSMYSPILFSFNPTYCLPIDPQTTPLHPFIWSSFLSILKDFPN